MPKPPLNDIDRRYGILAFRIVGEFGAAIAAPVVLLALLGKHLDSKYGTRPLFLIAGFALAAALSTLYVVRRTKSFNAEYQALDKAALEKKNKTPKP